MNIWFNSLIICFFACGFASAQTVYQTKVFSNQIKSLQVKVEGELISEPYIELNGEKAIEINFDALNHSQGRYAYSIIHCDADWKKSNLSPIEYMDGFQGMPIDDYAQAMTTTTHYVNFRLFLPNDNIKFKVSGNYIIQIYDEDIPDKVVISARFAVFEPIIGIATTITGNTDIAFNKDLQQLSFSLDTKKLPVTYHQTDLKIYAYQNNRLDDIRTGFQPTIVSNNRLTYEHIPNLIFEGGNEFRRIEFLTHRFSGMGIERIQYFNPYYHAEVMIDQTRAKRTYQYDQDQNGRFFIRCSNCDEPDIEADYYIVHFAYASENLLNGAIYLSGDLFQNQLDETNRMEYNPQEKLYEKIVLLKQGLYNYQYLFIPAGSEAKAQLSPTEGSFFQTENEYTILVYYHPMGARYDRLIGKTTVRNAQGVM